MGTSVDGFRVLYSALEQPLPWGWLALGLIAAAYGFVSGVLALRRRPGASGMAMFVIGSGAALFAQVGFAAMFGGSAAMLTEDQTSLRSGRAEVVEGVVTDVRRTLNGESFVLAGTRFDVDSTGPGNCLPGFHRDSSEGDGIWQGGVARIHHRAGRIIEVEVRGRP